jgi:hypothetical protein
MSFDPNSVVEFYYVDNVYIMLYIKSNRFSLTSGVK